MGTTLTAQFDNRRDAEMSVERLVQEQGIARTDIFIAAAGADNSAGEIASGADAESGHPGVETEGEPELAGKVIVSVDLADDIAAQKARASLAEFGAADVTER
jgi:hypothetical protein